MLASALMRPGRPKQYSLQLYIFEYRFEFESFDPLTAVVVLSFNVIIFNLKLKFQTSLLIASDEGELILSNKAL